MYYSCHDVHHDENQNEKLGELKAGMGLLSEVAKGKVCMRMLQPGRPKGGRNKSPMDIWREVGKG